MNSGKLNDWLGLLANVGVVVGIIFLVLELQQNRELTQVQIQQDSDATSIELNLVLAESDYFFPLLAKAQRGDALTGTESIRLGYLLRASTQNVESKFIQARNGMLPQQEVNREITGYTRVVLAPNSFYRSWFDQFKFGFEPGFVAYVESVLAEWDAENPVN